MKIAALYDIHGNFPALETVLTETRRIGVDHILVGGDVLPGPMPAETLSRLQNLGTDVQFLFGNGEAAVLEQMAGRTPKVPEAYRPIIRWNAEQLSPEQERFLRSWRKEIRLEVPGLGKVLFCHATPRNENECFTRLTPEDRLLPIFTAVGADMVICGHTHMQFDRMIGNIRVINAGSVGMPFGRPGADWLLLGPSIELHHTDYDLSQAAQKVCATRYPQAEEFASTSILHPPSEEEMLKVFAKVELK